MSNIVSTQQPKLYRLVIFLSVFTIVYNIGEGILATYLGFEDESLTLFGFGVDSFIETISGIGILHMVLRIRSNPDSKRDTYERTALKITGVAFYILVSGLVITSIYQIATGKNPETTFYGTIISLISIAVMLVLVYYKNKAGKELNSPAIMADAECTKVCIYMSLVLLISSAIYEWLRIPYTDSAGALILAWFSYREGKECFEKANSDILCGCDHHH